jgi:hypothetical protein
MNAEPCKKRFPLTGPEKQQMGLYPVKRWAICLDPDRPNKGLILVCPCNGCSAAKCKGFTTESVSGNPPTVTVIRAAGEQISENVNATVGAESPQ